MPLETSDCFSAVPARACCWLQVIRFNCQFVSSRVPASFFRLVSHVALKDRAARKKRWVLKYHVVNCRTDMCACIQSVKKCCGALAQHIRLASQNLRHVQFFPGITPKAHMFAHVPLPNTPHHNWRSCELPVPVQVGFQVEVEALHTPLLSSLCPPLILDLTLSRGLFGPALMPGPCPSHSFLEGVFSSGAV